MTTNDIPEGLELRKDGTIVLHLDGEDGRNQRVQLRRPKIKELREFRQDEWDIADQITEWTTKARAELDDFDLDKYDKDETVPADVARQVREITKRINREAQIMAEELRLPWAASVIDTLSPGTANVVEEDLPPWAATADFAGQLIGHWLTVPTRRGSQ